MRKLFILLLVLIFNIGYVHAIIIPNSFRDGNFNSSRTELIDEVEKWYNKGIALYQAGHYEKALFNFNQIIKAEISDTNLGVAKTYANLGIIHTILGNTDQAVLAFKKLIVLNDSVHELFRKPIINTLQRIIIHPILDATKFNKNVLYKFGADAPFKTLSSAASIYNNLGMAYFYDQNIVHYRDEDAPNPRRRNRAIPLFKKAIELDPTWAVAYNNLGKVYFDFDYDKKAFKNFTKAIELDPKFAEAYFNRSQVYVALKLEEQALEDLNKAIKLDPNYTKAYYHRSKIQLLRHVSAVDTKQALKDITTAITLDPKSAKLYNIRGLIQLRLNRYKQAIKDFKIAVKLISSKGLKNFGTSVRKSAYYDNQVKAEAALKKQKALKKNKCPIVF